MKNCFGDQIIDEDGYRLNVGIILFNNKGKLFWARRIGQSGWQFPQGGILDNESPEQALFRELTEEVGLCSSHVTIIGYTKKWLRYRLPNKLIRRNLTPLCVGQKQRWYLLKLSTSEKNVQLNLSNTPEFDRWRWVDYWTPLKEVVPFKRNVYRHALNEFAPMIARMRIRRSVRRSI